MSVGGQTRGVQVNVSRETPSSKNRASANEADQSAQPETAPNPGAEIEEAASTCRARLRFLKQWVNGARRHSQGIY